MACGRTSGDAAPNGPSTRAPTGPTTGTVAGVAAVLAAVNVAAHLGPRRTSLVVGPPATGLLLMMGRRSGLSWDALGLGGGGWRQGLKPAAAAVGLVGTAYAVAVALPATRPAFRDARHDRHPGAALRLALVDIPLGTVIPEEIAFRGVLWALLRRGHGAAWATAGSSALFGAWHVLPALDLRRANPAVGERVGHGGRGQALAAAATALAGVVLCELRRRSGGLLAPVGLHWAANGLGSLLSSALWRASRR